MRFDPLSCQDTLLSYVYRLDHNQLIHLFLENQIYFDDLILFFNLPATYISGQTNMKAPLCVINSSVILPSVGFFRGDTMYWVH